MNQYIDHTLLKPFVTEDEIKILCCEAIQYHFASVCVHPCWVETAHELLKNTPVKVCTVIGFPLGANDTKVKIFEAKRAYEQGCDEFDMVINIGKMKEGDIAFVRNEIKNIVDCVNEKTVKVIIETFYLTDEEKRQACIAAQEAGAQFVKTCTGFNDGIATVHDIELMKETVGNRVKIKASGGIRTRETAQKMIEAGADRIGTSSGKNIMEEQ